MSVAAPAPSWKILFTPKWLAWHLFAVVAVVGMLWLGDWQFHRAMAGNTLSWAYTFEWPIFSVFGVVFWVKTIRDELHPAPEGADEPADIGLPGGVRAAASTASGGQRAGDQEGLAGTGRDSLPGEHASGSQAAGDHDGPAAGAEDPELAEYNAYLARLSSQVKGHGRWHGLR
jgi:hypothetical protein